MSAEPLPDQSSPEITRNRSALRAFEVLEAFRASGRPMLLSEIARTTRMPLSTCHGVLRALEHAGYLYFLSSKEAYPTRRLLEMAQEIDAHDPIAARLARDLEALRDLTHETVILGALQNDHAVYLLVIESDQTIRYASRPGDFRSLHTSALGKAMLMALPEEERSRRLEALKLPRVPKPGLPTVEMVESDLRESRARGYTLSRGERSPDVMAIAMPLRLAGTTLAISVAGPRSRIEEKEASIPVMLERSVREIEARHGRSANGIRASRSA